MRSPLPEERAGARLVEGHGIQLSRYRHANHHHVSRGCVPYLHRIRARELTHVQGMADRIRIIKHEADPIEMSGARGLRSTCAGPRHHVSTIRGSCSGWA